MADILGNEAPGRSKEMQNLKNERKIYTGKEEGGISVAREKKKNPR